MIVKINIKKVGIWILALLGVWFILTALYEIAVTIVAVYIFSTIW